MIGVVIATHATLGQGIIDAIELIAGKQEGVKAIGLHHGDGIDNFEASVYEALEQLDEGDGVIGFVDFFGGTPANIMMKCMQKKSFPCVTGANMPMLLEALTNRDDCTLEELEQQCIQVGLESFVKLEDVFKEMQEPEDNDF